MVCDKSIRLEQLYGSVQGLSTGKGIGIFGGQKVSRRILLTASGPVSRDQSPARFNVFEHVN